MNSVRKQVRDAQGVAQSCRQQVFIVTAIGVQDYFQLREEGEAQSIGSGPKF